MAKPVYRKAIWRQLRGVAMARDAYTCRICGAFHGLQIDHIIPVQEAPHRVYDLNNLQTLCIRCHSRKTAREGGLRAPWRPARPLTDEQRKWRAFLKSEQHGGQKHASIQGN